jgi:hypothetical protein
MELKFDTTNQYIWKLFLIDEIGMHVIITSQLIWSVENFWFHSLKQMFL